jgi:serine/threonine protein kinase
MTRFGIGELTVLAELGGGAGSRVFHVRREADSADYALKVVPAGRHADPRFLEQLRHEFRVSRLLDHPHVAKALAFEIRRDWLFRPTTARLLVEFAPGLPLDRSPSPGLNCLLRVFEQVAGALAYLHDRGVFHADIKPGNLIYDHTEGVKLIDLGLAWVEGEPKNRVQGTPQYMAPETAAYKRVNARTDIYSLGATMYHLLTRRMLPAAVIGMHTGTRVRAPQVEPVANLNPNVPPELCDLVHRCISHNPDHRPADAREVQSILHQI